MGGAIVMKHVRELLPKKSMVILCLSFTVKPFSQSYITNKIECFSFVGVPCGLRSL